MLTAHTERYARQVALPQIGPCGQERLAAATVVIVGCGALGTVSAELLARSGIGRLRLVDDDRVELANLVGQTLFDEKDARTREHKVVAASRRLRHLNPTVTVEPVVARLNVRNAGKLISGASLVLDGTDNDATRYLINAACLRQGIPWIFAAVLESYGLIMNIVPEKTPCFACVFGRPQQHSARNDEKGALAAVTHMVASLQVSQALRLLLGDGAYNRGLVYVDALGPALETVEVKTPSEGCSACDRRRGNRSV